MDYLIVIRPLTKEEGGGFLALYPDLMGCLSDGETQEEALANARDALEEWMETNRRHGREIPAPGSALAQAKALEVAAMRELDERIEQVETDLEHLRDQVEQATSWLRFSEVTGILPDANSKPYKRVGAY